VNPARDLAGAAILALGVVLGGLFVGSGFARARAADRFVTVKGISEREVRADLAIWPLRLVAANNDLSRAHAQIESSVSRIRMFLASNQIDTTQSELQDFSVTDAATNQYGSGERAGSRYVIRQTVVVRSLKPDMVLAASQRVGDLVSAGVGRAVRQGFPQRHRRHQKREPGSIRDSAARPGAGDFGGEPDRENGQGGFDDRLFTAELSLCVM